MQLSVSVDASMKGRVERLAQELGVSQSELGRRLLEGAVQGVSVEAVVEQVRREWEVRVAPKPQQVGDVIRWLMNDANGDDLLAVQLCVNVRRKEVG